MTVFTWTRAGHMIQNRVYSPVRSQGSTSLTGPFSHNMVNTSTLIWWLMGSFEGDFIWKPQLQRITALGVILWSWSWIQGTKSGLSLIRQAQVNLSIEGGVPSLASNSDEWTCSNIQYQIKKISYTYVSVIQIRIFFKSFLHSDFRFCFLLPFS